jgi:hypothetical protein
MMQARFDGLENRRLRFIQADGVVLAPAVTQGQTKDDHLGQLAAQLQGVRGPIELPLPTGRRLEADRRLARWRRRPQLLQIRVQGRRTAGVAELAQLPQNARADQVLTEVPGMDLRLVRHELVVRPCWPLVVGRSVTAQRTTYRSAGHSELATDSAYPHTLRLQIANRCPGFHAKHPFWSSSWTLVHKG